MVVELYTQGRVCRSSVNWILKNKEFRQFADLRGNKRFARPLKVGIVI